jgi:hypothetical protein
LWTIYPAQQKNNFVVSTNMEQKTILWITNAMGQVIETKAIATGKQQCMIDLNSYKSGIYWLSILDNKQNITSKQIIVN